MTNIMVASPMRNNLKDLKQRDNTNNVCYHVAIQTRPEQLLKNKQCANETGLFK
jgi:hypothetical protein